MDNEQYENLIKRAIKDNDPQAWKEIDELNGPGWFP